MPLPTVYIARHGERLDFVDPSWRASAKLPDDAPLTSRGERQAADLGRRLRDANITTVITSPFQRCVRTASIAASHFATPVDVVVDAGVCEWLNINYYAHTDNGPQWRGLDELADEAAVVDGTTRLQPHSNYHPTRPHSFAQDRYPESRPEFLARCVDVVEQLRAAFNPAGNVLLLGHGSSVEGLIQAFVPGTKIPQITYACLTECIPAADGAYRVGALCDSSFQAEPEYPEDTRYV